MDGVDRIRAAARASLTSTGVRLSRVTTFDVPDGSTASWSSEIGVADPAARSARLRSVVREDSVMLKLGDAVVRRWPWLSPDNPSDGPAPGEGGEIIQIHRTVYYGDEGRWSDWSDLPLYRPRLVLWSLEALLGTDVARRLGTRELRGEQCVCYVGQACPGEVAGDPDVRLIERPKPDDEWREVFVEVCLGSDGLVRSVAWAPKFGKRRRGGMLPRLVSLADSSSADAGTDATSRVREVTELWDYGLEVKIAAPSELVTDDRASLPEIARDLWRMRRQYKRSASRPANDA